MSDGEGCLPFVERHLYFWERVPLFHEIKRSLQRVSNIHFGCSAEAKHFAEHPGKGADKIIAYLRRRTYRRRVGGRPTVYM